MTPEVTLWTKAQTAAFFNVSARTIDNWCAARLLPFIQLPCGKRFDPAKVKAFIRSREFDHPAHGDRQDSARVS
jgi:phage terminase Nu1 subunit (DNA packaging protein)